MDWRFNTIWFDKIDNNLFYSKDYKENRLLSINHKPISAEYFIFWYMRDKNLTDINKYKKIKYLELNSCSIKDFEILKTYWEDWFERMNANPSKIKFIQREQANDITKKRIDEFFKN